VVIDIMPDFVTIDRGDGSPPVNIEVVQMWCDPKYRDAWREPSILAYIERRAAESIATIIRWGAHDAITVFAPAFWADGQWHEIGGQEQDEHRGTALIAGLASARKIKFGGNHGGPSISNSADQGADQSRQADRSGLGRVSAGGDP
jgi:hypothetical protein